MEGDPNLFRNKYRIPSTRWKNWDYRLPGWYFVTICTNDRIHYFGEIENGRMKLSPMGRLVEREWFCTGRIRPGIGLDAFVIMPNHLHGIIVIKNGNVKGRDEARLVSTGYRISPHPGSLSAIVGSFKSSCTKLINRECTKEPFAWQPRFHDHVIRDTDEMERIRWYIRHNPENWEHDRNHDTDDGFC